MKDSSRITIDEFLQVRYGGIWAPVAGHLGSKNYASRHTFFSWRCSGARDRCLDPPKLRQMHQRWAKCDLKSKFTVAASKSPDARPAGEYISHPSLPPASFAGSFFSSFFSFFFFFLPLARHVSSIGQRENELNDPSTWIWTTSRSKYYFVALWILRFVRSTTEKNLFLLRFPMEKDRMEEGFYFLPLLFCTNLSRSHLRRLVMGAGYNTLDT